MNANTLPPAAIPRQERLSSLQLLTLLLGFLIIGADGFDVASVGYVAPLLIKQWALHPSELAPVFGAGLLGLCIGSFLFGPMADRIGRKRVILISMLVFGLCSLACAAAPSLRWLVLLRFATGMGLGGALPTMITLATEFAPERNRSLLVTLMLTGFSLGLALGGLVAARLIPDFGWKGVFVFGGIFPLCLLPVALVWLPESLKFMTGKPRFAAEAQHVLRRMAGGDAAAYERLAQQFGAADMGRQPGAPATTPIGILFDRHYRIGTLLLWLTFFCTLWVYYQLASWLPTVITQSGIDVSRAAIVSMMLPLGGAAGALLNAFLMDRLNPFVVLTGSYLIATLCIGLIGLSIHEPVWVYVTTFAAGFGLIGAQTGINVLASTFYTTAARATGVSWSLAVGRIGSILGAVSGGFLLASVPSVGTAFIIFALPNVLAGMAMLVCGRIYPPRAR